jgi:hypothetical protein
MIVMGLQHRVDTVEMVSVETNQGSDNDLIVGSKWLK